MSVKHPPWVAVSGPIYHPRELRPRKKWVEVGSWFLSFLLILGGLITPYRALVLFGFLYILTLLMVKECVVTSRGIEIYYQMRITTYYDFLGWDRVDTMLCEDRKYPNLVAVHFVYGDRVRRLFFTKTEAEQVMALAKEQNPRIVIKDAEEAPKNPPKKRPKKKA